MIPMGLAVSGNKGSLKIEHAQEESRSAILHDVSMPGIFVSSKLEHQFRRPETGVGKKPLF